MWEDFINQISGPKTRGITQNQFLACKIAIPFTWGLSTNQPNTLEYWNFCNQALAQNSANIYFPGSGDFVTSYEAWLNILTQKTNLEPEYINQVQTAHKKLDNHALELTSQYSSYRNSQSKTNSRSRSDSKNFAEWQDSINQDKLSEIKKEIDTLVENRSSAQSGLTAKRGIATKRVASLDYTQVWADFNKSSNFGFYIDSGFQVYNKRIFNWAASPVTLESYMRNKRKPNAPISSNINQPIKTNSDSDLPFLRALNGKNIILEDEKNISTPYRLSGTLNFEDTLVIDVSPSGSWFIESFLKANKAGPYNNPNVVSFGSQASPGQTYFFDGEKAILPGYITSITIGFNPSFSLSGDPQNLALINDAVQSTGGIHLGPIPFKNEHGNNQIDLSNVSNNVIKSSRTTNSSPAIIGVTMKYFTERNLQ